MIKVKISTASLDQQPKKYCRLIITRDKPSFNRLVESKDGHLELRLGVGKYKDISPRHFIILIRKAIRAAATHKIEQLAVTFNLSSFPQFKKHGNDWVMRTMAENIVISSYEFTKYKTDKESHSSLKEVAVCGEFSAADKKSFQNGLVVGAATNLTRDIANTSAEEMTPTGLASATKKALAGTKAKVKVLSEGELKKLKMNLLLAVGKGTKEPTKLILIEYLGAKDKKASPLVYVGKGITYDTGGLNVKPSGSMHDMHLDMSGGASVIGALTAIAKLGLEKNVIGVIPAAENAVSDQAMRAGDIITSMSGKTVEVLHTDAEGRMVLADALTYTKRYKPSTILDVATLTGAALIALGQHATAVMSKDDNLAEALKQLGETSGDYNWPLPLWDEYKPHLESDRADIANIATDFSRWGGSIEGGTFLAHFAPENTPWAHLDIAPRMEAVKGDHLAKGATGEPVRLLVRFAENH